MGLLRFPPKPPKKRIAFLLLQGVIGRKSERERVSGRSREGGKSQVEAPLPPLARPLPPLGLLGALPLRE